MFTYHIHITGQIQGVGFRPFVYRLASNFKLKGWVNNSRDGVHIEVNASKDTIADFLSQLLQQLPTAAKIESHSITQVESKDYSTFQIIASDKGSVHTNRISPDFAICPACKAELHDSTNQRFGYSFITCTQCGPRYSIQTDTPFDRLSTSMNSFAMCDSCLKEYNNPTDTRFYSQTNSCPECGIRLALFDSKGQRHITNSPIQQIIDSFQQGKIIAVKGIGGYLLMCDATNSSAIEQLRYRKNRPKKPFAIMYPNRILLSGDVHLSEEEEDLVLSLQSPVVLVNSKKSPASQIVISQIAPGLDKIGVLLPYAPLLLLIGEGFGKPLVATSGNISGAPIVYQDDEAINQLSPFADLVVTHNRDIVIPQDDSVVQVANKKTILLRRSRGYAPSYFGSIAENSMEGVIAMGSDMKASVAISHQQQWYVSQYLGNQEGYEAQLAYEKVLEHLMRITEVTPKCILVDQHPMYHTTQKGHNWAERDGLNIFHIQHHEAHFAAVLQENDLIKSDEPVLGVIWDGTGYGSDGNSWGGEFFEYSDGSINRAFHLNYVPLLMGDKMATEPRISALAFCYSNQKFKDNMLREKFSDAEYQLYSKMLSKPELFTSSIGRLFDAVASLLGLSDISTYEGEAALYLQNLAAIDRKVTGKIYPIHIQNNTLSSESLITGVIDDIKQGEPKNSIALKFNCTLVAMIKSVAVKMKYKKIAFSGGVFQNSLLVELVNEGLGDFKLYFHKELSPNDENISFGQLAHYHLQQRKSKQEVVHNEILNRI